MIRTNLLHRLVFTAAALVVLAALIPNPSQAQQAQPTPKKTEPATTQKTTPVWEKSALSLG